MGAGWRFSRQARIRGSPRNHEDNLASVGCAREPVFGAVAAIARQNHRAHECFLGVRRERYDRWSGRPLGSRASIWPALPPHHGSRAGIDSCSGHGPLSQRSDTLFRSERAFPLPRHSPLEHSHALTKGPIRPIRPNQEIRQAYNNRDSQEYSDPYAGFDSTRDTYEGKLMLRPIQKRRWRHTWSAPSSTIPNSMIPGILSRRSEIVVRSLPKLTPEVIEPRCP